jgi:hypothetical protein
MMILSLYKGIPGRALQEILHFSSLAFFCGLDKNR